MLTYGISRQVQLDEDTVLSVSPRTKKYIELSLYKVKNKEEKVFDQIFCGVMKLTSFAECLRTLIWAQKRSREL